jgi:hypothetical protein
MSTTGSVNFIVEGASNSPSASAGSPLLANDHLFAAVGRFDRGVDVTPVEA